MLRAMRDPALRAAEQSQGRALRLLPVPGRTESEWRAMSPNQRQCDDGRGDWLNGKFIDGLCPTRDLASQGRRGMGEANRPVWVVRLLTFEVSDPNRAAARCRGLIATYPAASA